MLRTYGLSGLRAHIEAGVTQAARFADLVRADERFEIVTDPSSGWWCSDSSAETSRNEPTMALMEAINASGTAYLSHTKVEGRAALRLATGSWRTTDADVDRTWESLVDALPAGRSPVTRPRE